MLDKLPQLASALRWLACLWILGWTLYVTIWGDARLSTIDGTMTAVATLLIPAALAFSFSWLLVRVFEPDRTTAGRLKVLRWGGRNPAK